MKKRTMLVGLAAAALAIGIAGSSLTAWSEESDAGFGPPFMRHGMGHMMGPGMGHMMGMGGPGMMGMGHDQRTMGQLRDIHALLGNHDRVRRTVTNLADGIRTETWSDDPAIAQLIKTHVADMARRVAAGDDPQLPIETPSLHAIFRDKDKVRTAVETTATGVVVVQTSTDPNTVAALQEHAGEVTELVQGGMDALHAAMMKNAGGPMHSRMMGGPMMDGPMMHGGMMRGGGGM
jgi:hypothetical protein